MYLIIYPNILAFSSCYTNCVHTILLSLELMWKLKCKYRFTSPQKWTWHSTVAETVAIPEGSETVLLIVISTILNLSGWECGT